MITSSGERRIVQIVAVNQAGRQVHFVLKDQGTTIAHVLEIPNCFVWPENGENWVVERKKNTWYLAGKVESPIDPVRLSNLAQGDGIIEANNVRLKDGDYVVDSATPWPFVVTGSRHDETALTSLISQLSLAGIIIDETVTDGIVMTGGSLVESYTP